MKKLNLLASVALMFVTGFALAQDGYSDSREMMQFGLKVGLNYSNVYDERTDDFNADAKFGFVGGGFLRVPIGKFLGVQPEILFAQKGFKGKGVLLGNQYNFTRTTSYIDIPLQIALKPSPFITLLAGPQYSFLIRQKDEFENTLFSQSQEQVFENDNIRKNILGFVAGVDVDVQNFVVGARLGWDMQNNNGNGTSSNPRYKNAWFQGTVGLIF